MIDRRTAVQFLRFSLVGLCGAVGHYSVLIAAVELAGASAVAGSMLGALVGATVNYTLARIFVFRAQRGHAGAIPRFLATAAASAVLNGLLMALFVNGFAIPYIPAQVIVTVILAVANYLASRHWTFVDRTVPMAEDQRSSNRAENAMRPWS